ncbi:MAG: hypothetical protein GEU86_04745 [Actinophytocola sp.]|nr:hypothetical protein [Actinophytocola sp.]
MNVKSSSDSRIRGITVDAPAEAPSALHRPWRAAVALGELVLAGVVVWFAFRLWSGGITDITLPRSSGGEVTLTRYRGDLIAGAIGLGALASLLMLDAVRQLLLAIRVRRSRKRDAARQPWPPFDEDTDAL